MFTLIKSDSISNSIGVRVDDQYLIGRNAGINNYTALVTADEYGKF